MIVDSHCHLNRLNLKDGETIAGAVEFARSRQIEHMLCVSINLDDFLDMRSQVAEFKDVSISCGIHPLDVEKPYTVEKLRELCALPEVVAIGETGLDYHYSIETLERQQQSFRDHIKVAKELNKPLIIHTRAAREDTIRIMREENAEQAGGVMHCYTEDLAMAQAAMEMGFYISFSGIVTFKNSLELKEVAKQIPLERMLVETDSPYLAPVPYRSKSNQPAYVREVAEYLAELKGISFEEFAQITSNNFYRLFSLAKN